MNDLAELFNRYGCEKESLHSYSDKYAELFDQIRNSVKNLLEVGVQRGASMKAWRDYFPNASIFGIDNGNDCGIWESDDPRITVAKLDSCDPVLVRRVFDYHELDIVIDDGSHRPMAQAATFASLWPYVARGGFYITEDVLRIEDADEMASIFGGEVHDLRAIKGRGDDILVVWRKK